MTETASSLDTEADRGMPNTAPSRTTFVLSATVLAVAAFANWPRTPISFMRSFVVAGFPRVFAAWRGGAPQSFYAGALAIDVAIPLAANPLPFASRRFRRR